MICEVCGRERPEANIKVYAVPGFPTSEAYCNDCVNAGANSIWLIKMKYDSYLRQGIESNKWALDAIIYYKGNYMKYADVSEEIEKVWGK